MKDRYAVIEVNKKTGRSHTVTIYEGENMTAEGEQASESAHRCAEGIRRLGTHEVIVVGLKA